LIRVYNKGKSTKNIISRFSGKAKEILLKQIDLFYNVDNQITKKYKKKIFESIKHNDNSNNEYWEAREL